MTMKFYFDGGCTPNPGAMEAAVISTDANIKEHASDLGMGTNNKAEWLAFLWAVALAEPYKDASVEILGDSNLVIMQAQGLWKCNDESLRLYLKDFQSVKANFKDLKLTHVRRKLNLAGIYIEQLQK